VDGCVDVAVEDGRQRRAEELVRLFLLPVPVRMRHHHADELRTPVGVWFVDEAVRHLGIEDAVVRAVHVDVHHSRRAARALGTEHPERSEPVGDGRVEVSVVARGVAERGDRLRLRFRPGCELRRRSGLSIRCDERAVGAGAECGDGEGDRDDERPAGGSRSRAKHGDLPRVDDAGVPP
jgi:hypothetical protein